MLDDIIPPERRAAKSERPVMRTRRLAGHDQAAARARLFGQSQPNSSLSKPLRPELQSSDNKSPKNNRRLGGKSKLFLLVFVFILVAGAAGYFFFYGKSPSEPLPVITAKPKKAEPPKPTTVASPLTGIQVAPELAKRPVTAIMIENSPDARPQSGLRDAGIIFEAIAEGGITRFATLFQEAQPGYIGPVRSLRPYYIDWIMPFDASVAHVGGSRDALDIIRSPGHKDLDQFFNGSFYSRIKERYAPHNVYTSFDNLNKLNSQKGFSSSTFTSWPRKKDLKLATPTAKTIDINVSGYYYNAHYDYDASSNTYLRSQAGKPHVDINAQNDPNPRQLNPKVVVVLVMPFSVVKASDGWRTAYGTTGSGPMMVFQDGNAVAGTWQKTDAKGQFVFKDSAGKTIELNAGQTWVTVVDASGDIKYSP